MKRGDELLLRAPRIFFRETTHRARLRLRQNFAPLGPANDVVELEDALRLRIAGAAIEPRHRVDEIERRRTADVFERHLFHLAHLNRWLAHLTSKCHLTG